MDGISTNRGLLEAKGRTQLLVLERDEGGMRTTPSRHPSRQTSTSYQLTDGRRSSIRLYRAIF